MEIQNTLLNWGFQSWNEMWPNYIKSIAPIDYSRQTTLNDYF